MMQPKAFVNHDHESQSDLNKLFLCLAENCRNSDFLCEECVLSEHPNHRVILFSSFVKRTLRIFSETRESLGKLHSELNKRLELCRSIQDLCEETKNFIKIIEEKNLKERNVLDQKLKETETSINELSAFTPEFFDFLSQTEKLSPNEEIMERISHIRTKLRLSSSFQPEVSVFVPDLHDENPLFSQVDQAMRKCAFSFQDSFYWSETLENSLPSYELTQIRKFELKRNYIVKNLVLMPNYYIVASGHDNFLRYFKIRPTEVISIKSLEAHQAWIRSLARHKDLLASGSDDSTLKLWKFNHSDQLELYHVLHSSEMARGYFWAISFFGDGFLAAGRGQNDNFVIRVWDSDRMGPSKICLGHKNIVRSLLENEKEGVLISGSEDGTFRVWKSKNLKPITKVQAHIKCIQCMSFNKKLGILATFGNDFLLKFWCLRGIYNCFNVIHLEEKLHVLANFEKYELLISGSDHGVMKIWDWANGTIMNKVFIGMEIHSILCDEAEDNIINSDSSGRLTAWKIKKEYVRKSEL